MLAALVLLCLLLTEIWAAYIVDEYCYAQDDLEQYEGLCVQRYLDAFGHFNQAREGCKRKVNALDLVSEFGQSHLTWFGRKYGTAWVGLHNHATKNRTFHWVTGKKVTESLAWNFGRGLPADTSCGLSRYAELIPTNCNAQYVGICAKKAKCAAQKFGPRCIWRCACNSELWCSPEVCKVCQPGNVGEFCNISVVIPVQGEMFLKCGVTVVGRQDLWFSPYWHWKINDSDPLVQFGRPHSIGALTGSVAAGVHTFHQVWSFCRFYKTGVTVVCKAKDTILRTQTFTKARGPRLLMLSEFAYEGFPLAFMCSTLVDTACKNETGLHFYLDGKEMNESNNSQVKFFEMDINRLLIMFPNASRNGTATRIYCHDGVLYSNSIYFQEKIKPWVFTSAEELQGRCQIERVQGSLLRRNATYTGPCMEHRYSVVWHLKDSEGGVHNIGARMGPTKEKQCHGGWIMTSSLEFSQDLAWAFSQAPELAGNNFSVQFRLHSLSMYPCCDGYLPFPDPVPCELKN